MTRGIDHPSVGVREAKDLDQHQQAACTLSCWINAPSRYILKELSRTSLSEGVLNILAGKVVGGVFQGPKAWLQISHESMPWHISLLTWRPWVGTDLPFRARSD